MAYTENEIKAFEKKDVRISRLAVLKSLIESLSVEEIYEVEKVSALAEQYVKYVYGDGSSANETLSVVSEHPGLPVDLVDWVKLAKEQGIAIPNDKSLLVLDTIWSKYKRQYGADEGPTNVLTSIIKKYGKYPTSLNSVDKVMSETF